MENKTIKITINGIDETGKLSDGFHSFDELYEHRITLYLALCRAMWREGLTVWRSKKHSDGDLCFGGEWFVLGIGKEKGRQITYHLPVGNWGKAKFAETLDCAPEYDGHTPEDLLKRLKKL